LSYLVDRLSGYDGKLNKKDVKNGYRQAMLIFSVVLCFIILAFTIAVVVYCIEYGNEVLKSSVIPINNLVVSILAYLINIVPLQIWFYYEKVMKT